MAGWKTNQILATMPGMLDLAAASGSDLARTADIVSDNMTAMGVSVDQAAHFQDMYAYALTNSNVKLEDIGEAMKYAAPVAKSFGATMEETAAMVMMMGNAGIKGSMAGTSLRMGLLRLAGPPKTATKEMQALGLSLSDAQAGAEEAAAVIKSLGIDMEGATTPGEKMTRVFMQLHEKTKDLSQDEKLAAFKGIFGVNAETGWLTMFEQGPEVFMKFVQGLQQCDGYAKQVAETMNDDTTGSLILLQSALDAVSNSFGTTFLDATRASMDTMTQWANQVNTWIQTHQTAVQYIGLIAAGIASILVVGSGLALVGAAFSFISSGAMLAFNVVRGLGTVFMMIANVTRIAAVATAAWGAITAAAGMIASAPIWLVVAAILAVVGLVLYATGACDGLGAALSEAWNHPQGAIVGFRNLVNSTIDNVVNYVMNRWNTLKSALEHPIDAVINLIDHGDVIGGNVKSGEQQTQIAKSHEVNASSGGGGLGAIQARAEQIDAGTLTLDTSQTQAALDQVGNSASQAATNMDGVNQATQQISQAGTGIETFSTSLLNAGTGFDGLNANILNFSNQSQTAGTNVDLFGNSALTAQGNVDSFGNAAGVATAGVDALSGSADSAGGQVGSMGAAADAVSAALSAKAAEISSIHISVPTVSVGGAAPTTSNAEGGIYKRGAFVTTFAEKSPEAAIPIEKSARARDLWTRTGQMLGMLPGDGGSYDKGEGTKEKGEVALLSSPLSLAGDLLQQRREAIMRGEYKPQPLPDKPKPLPKVVNKGEGTKETGEGTLLSSPVTLPPSQQSTVDILRREAEVRKKHLEMLDYLPDTKSNREYRQRLERANRNPPKTREEAMSIYLPESKPKTPIKTPEWMMNPTPTFPDLNQPQSQPTDIFGAISSKMPVIDEIGGIFGSISSKIPDIDNITGGLLSKVPDLNGLAGQLISKVPDLNGLAGQLIGSVTDKLSLSRSLDLPLSRSLDLPISRSLDLPILPTPGGQTVINITINVDAPNSEKQSLREQVESAIPALEDWAINFASHQHEEARRSFA